MAADPRAQAVFLLNNLIGYDHRPEFVNEHNASYRSDVLNVAQVFDAMQRVAAEAAPREERCPACGHWPMFAPTECPTCGVGAIRARGERP